MKVTWIVCDTRLRGSGKTRFGLIEGVNLGVSDRVHAMMCSYCRERWDIGKDRKGKDMWMRIGKERQVTDRDYDPGSKRSGEEMKSL